MLQIAYNEFKHSQEEVWRGRNINVEQHQESAKISGRCKTIISKRVEDFLYTGTVKIKYKKLFPRLLTLQTSADAVVRFTNIKEDRDIESHGKLLEREFMVHYKCYREYTHLPKDETVRCLKFHNKNANTTYYFFTISAYNNFLEFFWVKLILVPKQHFWDTLLDQTEPLCLLRKT